METPKEDLKEVIDITSTDGPVEKVEAPDTEVETEVEPEVEESIDELKDRLKKAEEERENLSQAVTRLNKEKKLTPDKEKEVEEDYPEWDETSKKFQKQTLGQAEKVAEERAKKIVEGYNEKAAITNFLEKHPEADKDWNEIITNYTPKNGKESIQDITKDLERALILHRYDKGEIETLEADAQKKGEKKGKAEAKLAELGSISKTTSKTVKEGNTLTESEIRMAKLMKVDLEKLAEEDMSKPATIEIN
jgi:hypothetical protein